jgi:nicotinamide-nucleotide amidase
VRFPEVDVKILARDEDSDKARQRAEQASKVVRERLKDCIYGEGPTSYPETIGGKIAAIGGKLAVAESCTGGLVASLITENPGVSNWFSGSIVSYGNEVKAAVLGVDSALIKTHGAVSLEVASAMVEGVCRITGASHGLAITGIAGPTGGTPDKPVGTVCFAVHSPQGTWTTRKILVGDRARVQRLAAYHGLRLVLASLGSSSPSEASDS